MISTDDIRCIRECTFRCRESQWKATTLQQIDGVSHSPTV